MKLKKIKAVTFFVLVVCYIFINSAYAMELQETEADYQILRWDSISDITISISADGRTLYPEVYVEAKSTNGLITGTMYLEKYSSGEWVSITSWDFEGTSSVFLSESYTGTSGSKYRTRVKVNVDGETAGATSVSCEI